VGSVYIIVAGLCVGALFSIARLPGQRSRPNANPANDEERSVPTMALEVMMQVLRNLTGKFIISMAFG
jgi:hypothetical protein